MSLLLHHERASQGHTLWLGIDVYIQGIQGKKNITCICHYLTTKTWLETKVEHRKQLAKILNGILLIFYVRRRVRGNGQQRRWTGKEKLKARIIVKTDNYIKNKYLLSLILALVDVESCGVRTSKLTILNISAFLF